MSKLILFLLLAYVIYRWLSSAAVPVEAKTQDETTETMLVCTRCGVHFPSSEAVRQGGKVFCSEQHSV
jgi:formylmethanofuran dehydrogenase subunit E